MRAPVIQQSPDVQASPAPVSAFRATLPVMFGYVPLGIAFGVLFARLGYPWYYAMLMALVIRQARPFMIAAVHLWRRNALLSIAAGTGLFMWLQQSGAV
jgi:predicted branched-subunit amino acid permease